MCVSLPFANIIPAEWKTVIDRIRVHGIKVKTLTKDTILNITTYRFSRGRSYATCRKNRTPYPGASGKRIIPSWDFSDTTFEQKEYAELCVLVKMAAEMLSESI